MAKRKCVICSQYIEKDDETVPYKNRYAHVKCFNSLMKMAVKSNGEKKAASMRKKKTVKVKAVGEALSEEEAKEKRDLIAYVERLFGEKANSKIYTQIKNMKSDFPYYTYAGIKSALEYFYEVQDNPITQKGVGIVPYIYDQAQKYFEHLYKTYEHNAKIEDVSTLYKETKIKIVPPRTPQEEKSMDYKGGDYHW